MKTVFLAVFLFSTGFNLLAQTTGSASQPAGSTILQDTPYKEVSRDADSSVWERTTYEVGPSGEAISHLHRYTEIATGLNHLVNGAWVNSSEEIDILPDGSAQAVQGQHQAFFPGDIYQGQIELVTPDGEHLRSRPMGLSYFDGQNSVLIAELTNSVGVVVGSNQVIYPDAFIDIKADLRYTYTKAGLEQDVILHEQPPKPTSYGLNIATTRLQVLTEFFAPPQPTINSSVLPAQEGLALPDETLDFGTTKMIRGRAFLLGDGAKNKPIFVSKQWLLLDGRQFLVEEVPVNAVVDELTALPPIAMSSSSTKTSRIPSQHLALPPKRLAKNHTSKPMILAKAELPSRGFVLDYQTVNGSLTNVTFQGDTTYYVSGYVSLYGTNTFEGGTVIKYSTNGSLNTYGSLVCKTAPYHPACFTSKDDNSIGENFGSGSPATGGIYLQILSDNINNLHDLRFSYAGNAIEADNEQVRNSQFVLCNHAITVWHNISLYNVLFGQCGYAMAPIYGGTIVGVNLTVDGNLFDGTTTACLTNCILADIPPDGSLNSDVTTAFVDHIDGLTYMPGPLFQKVGAGSYYLTNSSSLRSAGTTNIDTSLLRDLRQKTTYPPIVFSNITFSVDTNFVPYVSRDTNAFLDIGYHYDPLDDCFGGVTANANLTFAAGTAAGYFETVSGNGYGIALSNDKTNTFNGTVLTPCVFARYNTVQEGNGNWNLKGSLAGIATVGSSSYFAKINADFTHCYALASDPNHFRDYFAQLNVRANNCEFFSGSMLGYWVGLNMTNCLFDRMAWLGAIQKSPGIFLRNCTMHGGGPYMTHSAGNTNWQVWIENCAFDSSTNVMDNYTNTYCAYNAFLNGAKLLVVTNAHDQVISNFIWQSGPLGNWYQTPGSSLANTGSVTADLVGLYNFTTTTNQQEEGVSQVDIGYHYIALDGNGNILDQDSVGIPDWEDADPYDPTMGILSITIDFPTNGFILN